MSDKEHKIRTRAYELWEREGRSHGSHDRHWSEAARQIDAEDGKGETKAPKAKVVKKAAAPKPAAAEGAKTAPAPKAAKPEKTSGPKPTMTPGSKPTT